MYKLLATAAVALSVATPALAQSVPEKTGVNSTLGISPSTQDFVIEAANSDMLEIESSKLVAAKTDAKDKAFADQMIKDHTATRPTARSTTYNTTKASLPDKEIKDIGPTFDQPSSASAKSSAILTRPLAKSRIPPPSDIAGED
jgi:predicted outer membrane protein